MVPGGHQFLQLHFQLSKNGILSEALHRQLPSPTPQSIAESPIVHQTPH